MMSDDASDDERSDALEACIDDMEEIEATNHQVYHYYKIACIAGRGKLSGVLGRIRWGLKLRAAEAAALESTKEGGAYVGGAEAGGILRVMSAVRGNRKAKPLGLYDAQEAVKFSKLALESKGSIFYPVPAGNEPQHLSGKQYYENYYYFGQATVALGIEEDSAATVAKGQKVLSSTVNMIGRLQQRNRLPRGRDPETKYYKALMVELKGYINECSGVAEGSDPASWNSDWKSCLMTKLED